MILMRSAVVDAVVITFHVELVGNVKRLFVN